MVQATVFGLLVRAFADPRHHRGLRKYCAEKNETFQSGGDMMHLKSVR